MAVIGVVRLDPVRRDLDLVIALADDHGPEAVQVEGVPEDLLDLVRRRARRDVPVVRVDAAQRVPNAAADDVSLVPGRDEAGDDPLAVGGDPKNGEHPPKLKKKNGHYAPVGSTLRQERTPRAE